MPRVIWFIPIEPLHERYSEQMYDWVEDAFDLSQHVENYETLDGIPLDGSTEIAQPGQWLDTNNTVAYKASQMRTIAATFANGDVSDGDVFLFGDLWWPGIEQVRYMAELNEIDVTIAGWHYAGMFDPSDLLARRLGQWATRWEKTMLGGLVDLICVGSHYHKRLLLSADVGALPHVLPLGLAWDSRGVEDYARPRAEREKWVVFPHRFAPEKRPLEFIQAAVALREEFPQWSFIMSTSSQAQRDSPLADEARNAGVGVVCHSGKHEYYRWLSRASVWYSAAEQETFGYSLHEAIAMGLSVVAPRRCCYPEVLAETYDSSVDPFGVNMLRKAMRSWDQNRDRAILVPELSVTRQFNSSTLRFIEAIDNLKRG